MDRENQPLPNRLTASSFLRKERYGFLEWIRKILLISGIFGRTAGMVFQNPDNQIIGNIVEEDVGFGPENLGVPTEEIWKRVDESLEAVGMTAYRLKSPNKLSGGQKQRVAIAGVMAMRPQWYRT